MVVFYIDTSVLTKRYKTEDGTDFVDLLFDTVPGSRKHLIATSAITMIEFVSVIKRAQKGRLLTQKEAMLAIAAFAKDSEQISIRPMDERTLTRALDVVMNHSIKTLDSIHLGALLELRDTMKPVKDEVILISDDDEMYETAKLEKFSVLRPEDISDLKAIVNRK